jgi:hypothetical protein
MGRRLRLQLLVYLITLPGVLATLPASAQLPAPGPEEPLHLVPRIQGTIILDGHVDEPAWEGISPLPAAMLAPSFGSEPSERTEFRIAHDDEYVYFSCRNFDSEPSRIQSTSLRRNDSSFTNDICHLFLDTFNDEENALGFATTPSGLRLDVVFSNDAQGTPNFDWDTFWDTAVWRDERGWYAEMRIPFSSLLFQVEDGRVVMGMSMLRNIARKDERITHPAMPPNFGFMSFGKPSQMRKIVFEGIEKVDPVYITAYALAGAGYSHTLPRGDDSYARNSDRVNEVGADLKYGLTSNLTLDLTVNTDFAQVEADDQQVNLTRFSLFFPEKRRFFQERGAIFEYSLGGQERLFHSRRVGLAQGQPVRIYGGGRMVGRVGEWDVGILDMQTAHSALLPSENQGVVRLRRRVLNQNSYAGGIFTSRVGSGGHHNLLYGLDGIFRVVGNDYLTLNWAQSFDGQEDIDASEATAPLDRALLRLNWQRRGEDGLVYSLDLSRTGATFNPGLGFIRRVDNTSGSASVGYGWRPRTNSELLRYALTWDGAVFRRNEDRRVETVETGLQGLMELRSGHQLTMTVPARYENLRAGFVLPGGTSVPAGIHRFLSARFQYRPPRGARLRPTLTLEAGSFYDGRQASISIGPTWNPSMYVSVGGTYRLDYVDFPDRGEGFTAHVAGLRSEVMASTQLSAVAFVQYNSTAHAIVANFRFRYNPREGNDLYVVWNEGLTADRFAFDPVRPFSSERTVLVKYSHTLRLGL